MLLSSSTSRGLAVLLVLVGLGVAAPGPAVARDTLAERWLAPVYEWPVVGGVVDGFAAPAGPYGSGHRGADLAVTARQQVHPMADGTVTFAGDVAGRRWVSVRHDDGVVTSYGPLAATAVRFGQRVTRAQVLGVARGRAHGRTGRLHVGARRAGRYIDPTRLVADSPPLVATLVGPGDVAADAPVWPDRRPTLVPGAPPSPNRLVVLPGLTSRTGDEPFDLEALGYGPGHWQQFSYLGVDDAGRAREYGPEATWGRVHDMALALRDQLRAHAAEHPGQAVDLMGHSLGGLVGMYYLLVLHDATDPTLPPVGRIVTVASPLEGTDSADAIVRAGDNRVGRLLVDLVERHLTPAGAHGPPAHGDMPVLDDLRTSSPVVQAVADAWQRYRDDPWSSPLATGTDVLTLGTTLDPIVNEHRSDLPGADHVTVWERDWRHAHSDLTRDARTEELLAAYLAGEPLPDGGWRQDVLGWGSAPVSAAIAAFEGRLVDWTENVDAVLPPIP